MGRKTDITIAPASGIGGTTAQGFQYNGLAQTTFARDTAGANNADVTLVYDSIQRTVEEAQVYGGNTRYVTNDGFTSLPVSQFTYPNTRQVNNSFDKLYRRQQIIEAATGAVIASWQYFGPGRIATVTLGNGLLCSNMNNAQSRSAIQSGLPTPAWGSIATDQLGYDGAGRMIGKRYFNGTNVIVGFTSAYDMSSNKLFERPLQAEERSSLYDSYDSMNRLLDYQRGVLATGGGSVTTPIALPNTDQSRNYNLDALGNWTSSVYTSEGATSAITDQRNHNKLNEIIQRTVGTSPAVTFQYDGASGASNGNLVYDGALVYTYDALNRPIEIYIDYLLIAAYVYDAFNRRVRKTVTNGGLPGNIPDGTTDYIWAGWQVVEERNSSNAPIRQYVWGTYIDELIQLTTLTALGAQNLAAGAYYLLQDLLYRAVALTNSNGAVVEAYDTDAYGNTVIFTGPGADGLWFTDDDVQSPYGANEVIYCGYRFDPESELYYVRNRTYNPVLGRWLQRDPIGYAGGINLYEYVGGRAVVLVDPTGTLVVPGMPIPLPMHGAGPLKSWRGAIHDLGRGADRKCRFYVDTHYSQDLGTILTNGWSPTGEDWQAYVAPTFDILAKLTEVGGLVNELLSGTTFDTALYAYEAKVSFIKKRVFTYTCCKRYQNPVWESTTVENVHFSFWSLGSIQNANLNLLLPGSNERLVNAIKEWDAELLKHFILEVSP